MRIAPRYYPLIALLLVILPMAVQIFQHWYQLPLKPGTLIGTPDPDPWLRLTLVRDWLTGGSWYDHRVLRSDAPFFHTISPWTRPLDVVIAFFTELQPHSVDLSLRLIRTALLLPMFWMALLILALYRILRLFTTLTTAPFLVSAFLATALPLWNYFSSANADHHSFLTVTFFWALGGILIPTPTTRALLLSSLLFALQLWISPEAIALIAGVYGWFGLRWLAGERGAMTTLARLATGIALFSAAATMIERAPSAWFSHLYDSISIVYVFLLTLAALTAWLLQSFALSTPRQRFSLAALTSAICIALLALTYPLMFHGPMAQVDPYIFEHFLPRIRESESFFAQDAWTIIALSIQPLAAAIILLCCYQNPPAILTRQQCLTLGYFLLLTGALYASHLRFCYYFYPLLTLVLAITATALLASEDPSLQTLWPVRLIAPLTPNQQFLRRISLLVFLLSTPTLILRAAPSDDTDHSRQIDACLHTARTLIYQGLPELSPATPRNLFISTDLGAEILFFTPHHIIASNYHREGPGIRYIWEADAITNQAELRHYLRKRQVTALLLCPVVSAPDNSALQTIREGKTTPSWLTPIDLHLPSPKVADSNPALFLARP